MAEEHQPVRVRLERRRHEIAFVIVEAESDDDARIRALGLVNKIVWTLSAVDVAATIESADARS